MGLEADGIRTRDEVLALVSHELKTPLVSMLAAAEVLRSKETREAERARAFEGIERGIRAQATLIDHILDLSCMSTATLVELQGRRGRVHGPGEEKGATFTVDLPRAASAPQTAARPGAPEAGGREDELSLAGIHVLIVDDDADLRELLQFVLERYGAEVTAASSAAEALAALDRSMPDVLVSDIAMPGGNGYDLMREVAARPGGCALPAAALSAYSREQDHQQALAAGFRIQLTKPIVPEALVAAVASLAGRTLTKDPGNGKDALVQTRG